MIPKLSGFEQDHKVKEAKAYINSIDFEESMERLSPIKTTIYYLCNNVVSKNINDIKSNIEENKNEIHILIAIDEINAEYILHFDFVLPYNTPISYLKQNIIQRSEEFYRLKRVVEGTRIGYWDWNIQTGKTVFNNKWAEFIGYTLEELQPTTIETWMKFAHPDDLEESNRRLQAHFEGKAEYYDFEARMFHKDGHIIWVHDRGKVFQWTEDGKPLLMSGSHVDITAEKKLSEKLKKLNRQNSILLSEIHHRIRNHLHIVTSYLQLKKLTSSNRDFVELAQEVETMILSIARIHDILYKNHTYGSVKLKDYLSEIFSNAILDHPQLEANSKFIMENKEISIASAISIGLLSNEVITNSLKYGIVENKLCMEFKLIENGDNYIYQIKDSGKGFPTENIENLMSNNSVGMDLISSLAEDLNTESIHVKNENGALIELYNIKL